MNRVNRMLTIFTALLMLGSTLFGAVSCAKNPVDDAETTGADTTVAETTIATTTDEDAEGEDEETTTSADGVASKESKSSGEIGTLRLSALNAYMQPIFGGTVTTNETVMFLDKGDTKNLLYPIDQILSVTSYDGKTVYQEGKDYVVVDGKLQVTADSAIPCITKERFYNYPGSIVVVNHNGQPCSTYWGEAQVMTRWQVNVNYTHEAVAGSFAQASQTEAYRDFLGKLERGEDVTVFFYGDSITAGGVASAMMGYAPFQMPYPILFVQALAELYEYTVYYDPDELMAPSDNTPRRPLVNYVAGNRGTITYVNTAIGGWSSSDGLANKKAFVEDKVKKYGCDLFIVAFGMNDGQLTPKTTAANIEKIVDSVLAIDAGSSVMMVSTMVPNNKSNWYKNQNQQEPELIQLANSYTDKGVPCAVANMTSVSLAILERKDYHDYSGNNVNHPNDFFHRVYAQTLFQTLIGYENLS